ncbi:MAG: YceI family protein [Bacteroidota bacterium]
MKTIKIAFHALALAVLFTTTAVMADGIPVKEKKSTPKETALAVDPAKSELHYTGKKVTGEHSGTVKIAKGLLSVDGKKLVGGSFDIDMKSIVNTDLTDAGSNAKFIGHLKSEDFFSVDKYPTSTFKITKVEPIAGAKAGEANYTVTGDLAIKGITNPVTFPATVKIEGNKVDAAAKFEVNRTKWDIKYGSGLVGTAADKIIYDDFTIELKVVAGK